MTGHLADYWLAFTAGLLGSGHCAGMCGSLVSAFFLKYPSEKRILTVSGYHLTRIAMYAVFGLIATLVGQVLVLTGGMGKAQGVLKICIGLLILTLGLEMLGVPHIRLTGSFLTRSLRNRLFQLSRNGSLLSGAMLAGFVNAFLPCTLVFAMVIKAVDMPTPSEGALFMFSFGLGTLPAMTFVSFAFSTVSPKLRGALSKAAGAFVIILAGKTLWEGAVFFQVMSKLAS